MKSLTKYIIIDSLGASKGSVKAKTTSEAINIYLGTEDYPIDSYIRTHIMAIEVDKVEIFKSQISQL